MAHSNFALPAPGAPLSDYEEAARQLNAIPLTEDQIWRGYRVHTSAHDRRLAALTAWAESEGLHPADVAAHAVVVRSYAVMDALSEGIVLQTEVPEVFKDFMTGPIYPADLGWFEMLPASVAA
jgi:hypothetical protein